MKIIQIEVHSETRFNDEHESYRNHCPGLTLTAQVDADTDENAHLCVSNLQKYADIALEEHRQRILARRKEEEQEAKKHREIERHTRNIGEHRTAIGESLFALKSGLLEDWQRDSLNEQIKESRATIARSKTALAELTGSPIPIEDDVIDFEVKLDESAPAQDGKEEAKS